MPCIFCIAAFVLISGAVSAGAISKIEDDLAEVAQGSLRKLSETESVVKWELEAKVGRKSVPVAVTVFKDHARVRIQILTHALSRQEAEQLEDKLAQVVGAEVVTRSNEEEESVVRRVDDQNVQQAASEEASGVRSREPTRSSAQRKGPSSQSKRSK